MYSAEIFLVNLSPANSKNQQPSNATIQQIIHWPISHFLWRSFFITNTIKKSKLGTIKILTAILSRVNTIHVYQWNKAKAIIKALATSFSKPWIPSSSIF
jgi:hypothetical protein